MVDLKIQGRLLGIRVLKWLNEALLLLGVALCDKKTVQSLTDSCARQVRDWEAAVRNGTLEVPAEQPPIDIVKEVAEAAARVAELAMQSAIREAMQGGLQELSVPLGADGRNVVTVPPLGAHIVAALEKLDEGFQPRRLDTSGIYDRDAAARQSKADLIDKIAVGCVAAAAIIAGGFVFERGSVLDKQRDEALAILGEGIEEGLSEDGTYIVRCEEHVPGASLQYVASDYLGSINAVMRATATHWELDLPSGTREAYGFLDRDQDLTCFVVFQVAGVELE